MQDYFSSDRWLGNVPYPNPNLTKAESYSTHLYDSAVLRVLVMLRLEL